MPLFIRFANLRPAYGHIEISTEARRTLGFTMNKAQSRPPQSRVTLAEHVVFRDEERGKRQNSIFKPSSGGGISSDLAGRVKLRKPGAKDNRKGENEDHMDMRVNVALDSPLLASSDFDIPPSWSERTRTVMSDTSLTPTQMFYRIREAVSTPHARVMMVSLSLYRTTNPSNPIQPKLSDHRPLKDDGQNGSHIPLAPSPTASVTHSLKHKLHERRNREYFLTASGVWMQRDTLHLMESVQPASEDAAAMAADMELPGEMDGHNSDPIAQPAQTDMLSLSIWGHEKPLLKDSIHRFSQPAHGHDSSLPRAWKDIAPLKEIKPVFKHIQQVIQNGNISYGANQKLLNLAFDAADRFEPNNEVAKITINSLNPPLQAVGFESVRGKLDYERIEDCTARGVHRAFIAFGSNLGDRFGMIEKALREMERKGLKIIRTSSLWETSAMYVLDQDSFINGVCEVETQLRPPDLLRALQNIEQSMGREKLVEKGPRNIDLDILLYDDLSLSTENLIIPHPLIRERDFVLMPLCELIPSERLPPPNPSASFQTYLNSLPPREGSPPSQTVPLLSVIPPLKPLEATRSTHVMAILNVTPDSFSDGGLHSVNDLDAIEATTRSFISSGATIIDVGGQSTRPGATPLTESEELSRVIPVIEWIRSMPEATDVAIGIDTYNARVAEEAMRAGADIINDVSAGTMDENMLLVAAKLGKPIILMHMRGTPETMKEMTEYPDGIIKGVAKELSERVQAAEAAGIRRWRIILDPGIGFAKNQAQNLELLRRFPELRDFPDLKGFAWLIGTSRKNFIGRITGVEAANERAWGTAATVAESVRGGADIVRVHDVSEMTKVVKMADAIWRVEKTTEEKQKEALEEAWNMPSDSGIDVEEPP